MNERSDPARRARNLALLIEQPAALADALARLEVFISDRSSAYLLENFELSIEDLELIAAHSRATSDGVLLHILQDKDRKFQN